MITGCSSEQGGTGGSTDKSLVNIQPDAVAETMTEQSDPESSGEETASRPGPTSDSAQTQTGSDADTAQAQTGPDADTAQAQPGPEGDTAQAQPEPEGDTAEAQPEPEGNTAEAQPEPAVDTTPPVFKEYRSHLVYIGDTVSYRGGVVLTDDSGEEPVLTIDSSKVNLKEAGEYPLTYTATDAAGNTASCEVSVVVREREEVTQEMLDAKADEIIEEVLADAPRDIEALEKLFKWTKKNIHYVNYFEQNDDISAAWEGLMYERGDCYVYACASKELLSRAGFKNDMIRTSRHFWNLVDLGEGWYHYDTCPRKDKPYFFMWGDSQLMEYSHANGNSHDYDHTKWPDVVP